MSAAGSTSAGDRESDTARREQRARVSFPSRAALPSSNSNHLQPQRQFKTKHLTTQQHVQPAATRPPQLGLGARVVRPRPHVRRRPLHRCHPTRPPQQRIRVRTLGFQRRQRQRRVPVPRSTIRRRIRSPDGSLPGGQLRRRRRHLASPVGRSSEVAHAQGGEVQVALEVEGQASRRTQDGGPYELWLGGERWPDRRRWYGGGEGWQARRLRSSKQREWCVSFSSLTFTCFLPPPLGSEGVQMQTEG